MEGYLTDNPGGAVGPCKTCEGNQMVIEFEQPAQSDETFAVYPNPSMDGDVVITHHTFTRGGSNIRVTDSSGRTVWNYDQPAGEVTNNYAVSLGNGRNMSPGLYFVTVVHGQNIDTQKLIIY